LKIEYCQKQTQTKKPPASRWASNAFFRYSHMVEKLQYCNILSLKETCRHWNYCMHLGEMTFFE